MSARHAPIEAGPRRWARRRWAAALVGSLVAVSCTVGGSTSTGGPGTTGSVADRANPSGGTARAGSPAPNGTALATRPATHAVGTSTVTLVDRTRPTEAGAQTPARPDRTLETHLFVPDGAGPFPLIVFSHGLAGHPTKFSKLLGSWARAGFVVAAPAFPLTNNTVPGSVQNWTGLANQPADVRFVIDQLLALDADPTSAVAHRINHDRIGVGGLSLGGGTTYAVGFNECCRDPRVDAVVVLAGMRFAIGGEYVLDGHVPLLIEHGTADASLPYANAVDAFATARSPVWFVTLDRGTHAPPFEDHETEWDTIAEQTTTDFWLGTLTDDAGALSRLDTDASVPGRSSIQKK